VIILSYSYKNLENINFLHKLSYFLQTRLKLNKTSGSVIKSDIFNINYVGKLSIEIKYMKIIFILQLKLKFSLF
jgi:hypothetical protein